MQEPSSRRFSGEQSIQNEDEHKDERDPWDAVISELGLEPLKEVDYFFEPVPDDPFEDIDEEMTPEAEERCKDWERMERAQGPLESYHSGQIYWYRTIDLDCRSLVTFKEKSEEILQWISDSGAKSFSFTLLNKLDVKTQSYIPTVLIFTSDIKTILGDCPGNLPFYVLRQGLINYSGSRYFTNHYQCRPRFPWYEDKVMPGSSIGILESGSLGGYIKSTDGVVYGLTAGHVAREFEVKDIVFEFSATLTSPCAADVRMEKVGKRATSDYVMTMTRFEEDKSNFIESFHALEREPENLGLQETTEKLKSKALRTYYALKRLERYTQSENMIAPKFATTLLSVVDTQTLTQEESKLLGLGNQWSRNEDIGLLRVEEERIGKNVIRLSHKTIEFNRIGEMREGMLVVKRGRSTGLTFGRVSPVRLQVKPETSPGLTVEWLVMPVSVREVAELHQLELFQDYDMLDELSRSLVITYFAHIGDSGSLVIDVESRCVVGMVIGGLNDNDPPVTIVTPISFVIDSLNNRMKRHGISFDADCFKIGGLEEKSANSIETTTPTTSSATQAATKENIPI